MKKKILLLLIVLSVLLTACSGKENKTENNGKLQVVTSFYPVYLLAQTVTEGAEGMELWNMAQPQTGCLHDYELTISDMKMLEGADVLIINGGGMEGFLEQALERYPELIIVDTSAGIELLEESHHHHDEETEAEQDAHADHAHEGNPHIWLSPEKAAHQAETIAAALGKLDAEDAGIFAANAENFHEAAHSLQEKARHIGIPEGECAAVFHEGFAYLAEAFDLTIVEAVEEESGSEASAKDLIHLIEEVEHHSLPAIFTERSGSASAAGIISRETGAGIFTLDMAMAGESYFDAMYHNIDTLKEALQ